jgi:hypothetical protein
MKTLILFSTSSTFRPRSVVASLAVDQLDLGDQVSVLDIGAFSYITQDLPPRWWARIFRQDVHTGALEKTLQNHGIDFQALKRTSSKTTRELPEHVLPHLEDAINSELVTYLRTDKPDTSRWFPRYTSRKLRKHATPLYWALREFLSRHDFDRVLIPNGRVPDQRLALLACRDAGLEIHYYEIGRALENSYYAGEQQIHDREGTQAEVLSKTSHLSDGECEAIALQWLHTRMTTGLSIHPFNRDWRTSAESDHPKVAASGELAVFFSSSVDEFASYGGSWKSHTWADQYEAFEAIAHNMLGRGVRCVLRIHPNLQNKSRSYVNSELRRIAQFHKRFPTVRVLSHTDPTSSYDLVRAADYIIVGRSTLGLEAGCLGKCVWTTTAARYDAIADVRTALGPETITPKHLTKWPVDPAGAHRFVAYWVIQDHVFRYGEDNWATWDSLRAPLAMRVGNLLVRNSIPHKIHLLRSELIRYRNRKVGQWLERG